MTNYIPDVNKFSLAGPPKWWLAKLWEFDNSLVVVPSRQACVYRLAQRRKLNLPESIVNEALFNQSDTQMLATYGLVPVTTIIATCDWGNPYLFKELHDRAPHRNGGADESIKAIEAQEAKEEFLKTQRTSQMLDDLAKDSWGMYKKKIGVQSHMYIPRNRSEVVGGAKAPAIHFKKTSDVEATSVFSK